MRLSASSSTNTSILTKAASVASANLISNLDATTLSLSNGAAVAPWTDPQGNIWTSFGIGSPTYTTTGFDGGPGVIWTAGSGFNTGTSLQCNALASLGSSGSTFSVAMLINPTLGTADQYVLGLSDGATTRKYIGLSGSNASTWAAGTAGFVSSVATPSTQPQGGQATYTFASAPVYNGEDEWIVYDFNGYQSGMWVSGSYLPTPTHGDEAQVWTKLAWGLNNNGQLHPSSPNMVSKWLRLYSAPLGKRGVGALVYYFGLQNITRVFNTALGDSILDGFGGVTSWYSTSLLPITSYDVLPNGLTGTITRTYINNQGTPSRTIWPTSSGGGSPSNSLVQATLNGITQYGISTMPCMIIITAGSNDIYLGGGVITGAQVIGYLKSFIAQLKSIAPHCYIVPATLLNRGNWSTAANYAGSDTSYNNELANYNSLLRTQWASIGADAAPIDFNAISGLQNPGTTASTGPNFQDACHPTQTGQNLMAALATSLWPTLRIAAVNKWASVMMQN